jgi:hypothetical protein
VALAREERRSLTSRRGSLYKDQRISNTVRVYRDVNITVSARCRTGLGSLGVDAYAAQKVTARARDYRISSQEAVGLDIENYILR